MKIILINGAAGSGKSTFCDSITDRSIGQYSTVDEVKRIARLTGWDGEKTPKARKFLSDLKDLLSDFNDLPVTDCEKYIAARQLYAFETKEELVIFIHCREPQELERLKEKWNARTLLIRRFEAEHQEVSNHADAEVLDYEYDYVINNDGSLEELKEKAKEFLTFIRKEDFKSRVSRSTSPLEESLNQIFRWES